MHVVVPTNPMSGKALKPAPNAVITATYVLFITYR